MSTHTGACHSGKQCTAVPTSHCLPTARRTWQAMLVFIHPCNLVGEMPQAPERFQRNWLRTGSAEHLLLPFHKRIQKTNNTVFPWSISARIFIVGLFNLASVTIANPSFFFTDIFSFSHGRPHTLYSSKSSSVTFYVTNNFIDILAAFWCTSIPNICLSKANSVLPCSWNNKCSLIFRQ